jgi:hypothetical protein
MQSSNSTSPLLNHAIKTRAKNVELRKKITQLQTDIQSIENDISTLTNTYDHLVEQCQILREKQTDTKKDLLLEESQKEFHNYIRDIENYINNKQLTFSSIEKPTVLCKKKKKLRKTKFIIYTIFLAPKESSSIESVNKIDEIPIVTMNDDLNQQLASVENWLMESAVTDINKQSPMIKENQHTDDGTDDLYKDLIFPTLSDDLPTQSEDMQFNENNHQEEFVKTISPENTKQQQQQRPDKNQRRFALMRQLAEKSNKTVTRKLLE